MGILIRQLELGPMNNFVYCIGCQRTKETLVVDPAWEVGRILEQCEKDAMTIKGIFVTHTHFDHVNGVSDLLRHKDVPVYIHEAEYDLLPAAGTNRKKTREGDILTLGDLELLVLHTPGHTPGSQCLSFQNNLISGDTLFIDDCGRTDMPGGSDEAMFGSLSRLKQLDDETILLSGHNYSSVPSIALGLVKKSNHVMRSSSLKDFLRGMGKLS
ncbi:MAG: MBL fold metallo-hydrolase [Chlamydiota bacterium]|nr:MBL fold metallo-hydrolase [Chlamydiota bacterium]